MKALLINPYVPLEVVYGKSVDEMGAVLPPLGILYLTAYIRKKSLTHIIEPLDANALLMDAGRVVDYMRGKRFDLVGLSSTTLAYPYAVDVAAAVKAAYPDVKVILGGPHAQASSEGVLGDNPGMFDYVCYGEGELAFESLLGCLSGETGLDKLIGWRFVENGEIVTAPPAISPDNIDPFGHPSEVVPAEWIPLYHEKILAFKELPMFSVMSSRGCPFQCSFCSTPRKFIEIYQRRVRYHSIEWIKEELDILQSRFGVREVIFVDDTFNLKKPRVMEFCDMMIKRGRMTWSCNFEANIADYEMMKKMREAGCWSIMVGGESGSDRMLLFVTKGVTRAQLELVGRYANEIGIVSRISFILGLPSDTVESVEETIDFVSHSDIHFPYFQLYVPLPGTRMYGQLAEYGQIIDKDPKLRSASNVNYLPRGLTADYLMDAYHRAYRGSYIRWRMVRNHLQFIRSWADVRRYWKGLRLLKQF